MSSPPPRPQPSLRHAGWFSAVPVKVRWLVYLSAPTNAAGGFFFVVIAAYLPELGLGSDLVGLILGMSGVAMVLSAIPLGLVSDRRGRRGMLIAGALGFPPVLLILALTADPTWLVLAGIAGGIAEAAFLATWNALIADGTPLEARNSAFSLSFVVGTTTSGLGFALPLAFPAVQAWTGADSLAVHRGALLAFTAIALITPVGLAFLLRDHVETFRPRKGGTSPRRLGLLYRFSAINGVIGLGAGFIIPLIPTWLYLKFGVLDIHSGPLLALSSLTMGLAAFGSAALAARYGSVRAIVMTQGLSTAFMVSLAFVPNAVLAGGLYVVRAALMNMASPIMDAYLMGIIAPDQRGFASALNSIVRRLPNSVSTVAGGVLLASGEYELPFLLAAGLYLFAISLFYVAFRNVRPRTTETDATATPEVS